MARSPSIVLGWRGSIISRTNTLCSLHNLSRRDQMWLTLTHSELSGHRLQPKPAQFHLHPASICHTHAVSGCASLLPRHAATVIVISLTSLAITAMSPYSSFSTVSLVRARATKVGLCVPKTHRSGQPVAASLLARPYSQGQPEQQRPCSRQRCGVTPPMVIVHVPSTASSNAGSND